MEAINNSSWPRCRHWRNQVADPAIHRLHGFGTGRSSEADGDWRKGFSTPHVAELEGQQRLLSIGSKALYAYEPLTGKEIWHTESRIGHSASSRPTIHRNQIYYLTGFSKGELWAVRPGGQGHVTDTHVRWTFKRSVPNKPSMIAHEDCLFMIHDGGWPPVWTPSPVRPSGKSALGATTLLLPSGGRSTSTFSARRGKPPSLQPPRTL